MDNKKLKYLFSNMSCSACGADFREDSFKIVEKENSVLVLNLSCKNCLKDFGLVFIDLKHEHSLMPFCIESTPKLISRNEVIDAHNFIKKLDHSWQKHIPKDFK